MRISLPCPPHSGNSTATTLNSRLHTAMAEEKPELEFYDNNSGDVDKEFEEWKQKFEKSYESPEEEAKRKKLWLQTRVMVTEHNRKYQRGMVTYTMGVNQFADLTLAFKRCTVCGFGDGFVVRTLDGKPHTVMGKDKVELELYDNNSGDVDREFEEWKYKFKKSYESPEEEAKRKKLWLQTRVKVTEHNRKYQRGMFTYTMGVNQFADQAEGEYPHSCLH
ncbi:hypothetical protein JZ751_011403 [Albula glossodonta]|uniref:Cathepsin propeptide inhibitor domain-containing protein n=1 Tax=Albula glossodonta TaxID=121402 RepID=A0A8T2N109_9TELE|nr:hypothetical protein JZ751_011403 [Albula glossodonta]